MTDPTISIDLDALEKLEREATPGPWAVKPIKGYTDDSVITLHPEFQQLPYGNHIAEVGHAGGCKVQMFEKNSALIAALRNAAPELLRMARVRSVPAGWTPVPVEPTEAMCEAAMWNTLNDKTGREIVKSAIAAAPTPPAVAEAAEPIYQFQGHDGRWIDQTEASYRYNAAHGHAEQLRIVYTSPRAGHEDIAAALEHIEALEIETKRLQSAWDSAFSQAMENGASALDAKAELQRLQEGAQWRDIATAPHDQRVLVRTDKMVYVAQWVTNLSTGDEAFCVADLPDGERLICHPNAWMPAPPTVSDDLPGETK